MKLQFELTQKDYIEFNIYHINHSKAHKRALFFQRYIFPLIFFIVAFIFGDITDIPLYVWLITFSVVWLLWVLFYKRYYINYTVMQVRQMMKDGNAGNFFGPMSIEICDEGIVENSRHYEQKAKWSGIDRIGESKDNYFIYLDFLRAIIIPKRCFINDEQKDAFVNEVKSKLSN